MIYLLNFILFSFFLISDASACLKCSNGIEVSLPEKYGTEYTIELRVIKNDSAKLLKRLKNEKIYSPQFNGLCNGSYSILVRDKNGLFVKGMKKNLNIKNEFKVLSFDEKTDIR